MGSYEGGFILVIYRMCDIPSTNVPPVYPRSKSGLNLLCLRSFVKAFEQVNPSVIFLCDHCPPFYTDYIDSIVKFPHVIIFSEGGINQSYLDSMKKGLELSTPEDTVLFQECDYLYRPNTGSDVESAIKHFGYMTPYDHPDHYPKDTKLELWNGLHWRTSPCTTMTYGVRGDLLRRDYDLLTQHGYLDQSMWIDLLKAHPENHLWSPIPSIATHMVREFMAPNVEWSFS